MSQARNFVGGSLPARFRSAAYALVWFTSGLLMTSAAWAQDGRTIDGRVVDTSDAVIVGAEVTVTDTFGGSHRMVTDERGEFRFPGLAAGDYIVQVERAQFRRSVVTVHLGTGDAGNALRVVLRAAGPSEQLTVIGRSPPYAESETTTAGKVPVARRQVPSSVSVLTREQMNDQHMVNTWDALSQITGVTAISNDGTQSQFHARGAALESQQDGMPSAMPLSGYQQYDLAIYERVEVLRGPAGLLQGSGAFSGTVNFVRRRPTSFRSASAEASIGQWNNRHVQADVSLPLTPELRALAIFEHTDREFYYDRGRDRKWVGYGVLEWTPGTATVLGFTAVHQHDRTPGFSGLPTYSDGRLLDVKRSFNPFPEWNRNAWDTTDLGADIQHRFNSAWQLAVKVNRRRQNFLFHDSYPANAVNPATNTLDYARRESDFDYTSDGADVYASGRFDLLAIGQEWLVGANASRFESLGHGVDPNQDPTLVVRNIVLADPPAVPEPSFTYRSGTVSRTGQSGLYTLLRSRFGGRVTTAVGGRWTNFTARSRRVAPSVPTDWAPGAEASMKFTPYAGVVVDVAREFSLYTSYAEIFVPQTQKRVDGTVLEPRVGHQWEFGAKGEHLSKRLLTALAVFDIRDRNRAYADSINAGFFVPLGEVESKGWEVEVTGRVALRWDLSAGYTWLDTKYLVNETRNGQALNYLYPTHSLKAWSTWRVSGDQLKGLTIGAGVQAYSKSASGLDTVNAAGAVTVAARRQPTYAVASANLSYPIQRHLQLAAQLNNVFDRTYYTRLGGTNTYNTFGEPRSVMVSLRWQSAALR